MEILTEGRTNMRLKTVTLIAAIAQSLALAVQLVDIFRMIFVEKLEWSSNHYLFIGQPIWIFAQITLVIFFFALYARQKQ
jgi:hypothetical protein